MRTPTAKINLLDASLRPQGERKRRRCGASTCHSVKGGATLQTAPSILKLNPLPLCGLRCPVWCCQNSFFGIVVVKEDDLLPGKQPKGFLQLRVIASQPRHH